MYLYKSVSVPIERNLKAKTGDGFKSVMELVDRYTKEGWRLVQIVIPPNEKTGVVSAYAYEIIFEKTAESPPNPQIE